MSLSVRILPTLPHWASVPPMFKQWGLKEVWCSMWGIRRIHMKVQTYEYNQSKTYQFSGAGSSAVLLQLDMRRSDDQEMSTSREKDIGIGSRVPITHNMRRRRTQIEILLTLPTKLDRLMRSSSWNVASWDNRARPPQAEKLEGTQGGQRRWFW